MDYNGRGEAVVATARGWIGTPYCHQAATRGAGCDCLGLVRGVWRDLHGAEIAAIPPYGAQWSAPREGEALWRALAQYARPAKGAPVPGQVLLFRMRARADARHLGILAAVTPPSFVHAYSGRGVVESPLSPPWARRVVARFDLF